MQTALRGRVALHAGRAGAWAVGVRLSEGEIEVRAETVRWEALGLSASASPRPDGLKLILSSALRAEH